MECCSTAGLALAANSPALKDPSASLLSPLKDSRRVARDIAVAVGIQAQEDGVAPTLTEDELGRRVRKTQWTPPHATWGYHATKSEVRMSTNASSASVIRPGGTVTTQNI